MGADGDHDFLVAQPECQRPRRHPYPDGQKTLVQRPESLFRHHFPQTINRVLVKHPPANRQSQKKPATLSRPRFSPSVLIHRLVHDPRLDDVGGRAHGGRHEPRANAAQHVQEVVVLQCRVSQHEPFGGVVRGEVAQVDQSGALDVGHGTCGLQNETEPIRRVRRHLSIARAIRTTLRF